MTDERAGWRSVLARHRRLVGAVAGIGAIGLACLWLVLVPERAGQAEGVRAALIRYGHSLCRVLLALAAFLWAARAPRRWVEGVAWSALVAYVAFLLATFL